MLVSIGILMLFIVAGCKEQKQKKEWVESPTFTEDSQMFYGVQGKIGIVRENGGGNEPDFPAQQGRLYTIYYWGDEQNGQVVQMIMTHEETGKIVEITDFETWNNKIGVKIGFEHEGLWKINVTVDEKPYTEFIIRAKPL